NPAVEGILFDLPHTREGARRLLEEAGVAGRCRLVSGDFFEAVPGGGDAYVLKSVIHDWDDRHASRVLDTCRRAMPAEATLLLIERVVPDRLDTSVEHQSVARSDLHMLVAHGAKERTEAELGALLAGSGFDLVRVVPAGMGLSLLEAVPSRTPPSG
ncbi:MAG TPA: methyltransferase, partial [Acidimicrobiales bacterium]|nr:methyltransferase [Acidimicrobiales bacterium]